MRIGIYPRKSVYRDNSDSVSVQIKLCKEYADIVFRGQEIEFAVYDKDEGFTGKNMNRPGFRELMADVRGGRLDVVMVYRLDRISRNIKEFSMMYETFLENNVVFISVKESFDTTTPIGRTVMYILAVFAQLERENTSERVGDNMLMLAAAGRWTGGKLPSGMKSFRQEVGGKEHSFLLVDEDTVWRVKLLYDLMLDGMSITKIERYCRDHGIKSQSGKFLNTSQIYNILTNPVYCQNSPGAYRYLSDQGCIMPDESLFDGKHGLMSYGKTKTGKNNQPRQEKDCWTISVGVHDHVIDSGRWIACQERLGVGKQFRARIHEAGILNGILTCKCGSKMRCRVYEKNRVTFAYYYCDDKSRKGLDYVSCGDMRSFVRVDEVDRNFIGQLSALRVDKNSIFIKTDPAVVLDENKVLADLKRAEGAIRLLVDSLASADGSAAAKYVIAKIEELDRERELYRRQLSDIKLGRQKKRDAEEVRSEIYKDICHLIDNFESLTYPEKNELVKRMLKSCVLHEDRLEIAF